MDDFRDAKAKYESWCKTRNWEFGPTISHKQDCYEDFCKATRHIHDLGLNRGGEVLDSGRVIKVLSPWHAAVHLFLLQDYAIKSNSCHFIFRGQKRSSWGLTTAIDRLKEDKSAHFRAFSESIIFSTLMKNLHTDFISLTGNRRWNFELVLPLMAFFPVAQHHGIPTPFLDFTADPSVAVFFASRDNVDREETASVYCYRFPFKDANANDVINMRFVPPFIERPYLQKGIFIETIYQGDLMSKISPDIEIRFPVRQYNDLFKVFRNDTIDILPQEDEEIRILKAYAKAGVSELIFEFQGKQASINLIQEFANNYARSNERILKSLFKNHVTDSFKLAGHYIELFEDMLYWFCYHPCENGLNINIETLEIVTRSNPEIVNMVIAFYRWRVETPNFEAQLSKEQRQFIIILTKQLVLAMQKAGFDPDKQIEIEKWLRKS